MADIIHTEITIAIHGNGEDGDGWHNITLQSHCEKVENKIF